MWEKIKKHSAKIISVLVSIILVIGGVFAIKSREESKNSVTDDLSGSASNEEPQEPPLEEVVQNDESKTISEFPTVDDTASTKSSVPAATTPVVAKPSTTINTPKTAPKAKTKTKSS